MDSSKMNVQVWYLYHSGFAVQTPDHFLIFDYYNDSPAGNVRGLDSGVINPAEIQGKKVMVFSSHSHGDHFNPKIFSWKAEIPGIRYILSNDIHSSRKPMDTVLVSPGKQYTAQGAQITVLKSTDLGVAFAVYVDGLAIYHAGDLNWWHWEGEPDADNRRMAEAYREQIDTMRGRHIDIAFVPLDPRQEKDYLLGMDYFIKTVDAKAVFPMHFGSDYSVMDWIKKDSRAAGYLNKIKTIARRGEKFEL